MKSKPCKGCPFREETSYFLGRARAQEIVDGLRSDGIFHCHETVDYGEDGEGEITRRSRFCAGALAVMHREGSLRGNFLARLLLMVGSLREEDLDAVTGVPKNLDDWVRRQEA